MKKVLALATAAALAAITACSVSTPVREASPTAPAQPEPGPTRGTGASGGTAGPPSSSSVHNTRAACELFNSLYAAYAAVPSNDSEGYEDIYLRAEDAKGTASGDLRGLFAALGLLAIDRSGAAGAEPARESKDAVRDAVFANAGTCTAEGVTLLL